MRILVCMGISYTHTIEMAIKSGERKNREKLKTSNLHERELLTLTKEKKPVTRAF